jgi:hypothetical protein
LQPHFSTVKGHRHRKIEISSQFRSSIAITALKKLGWWGKTATTVLLDRELNQRKSTNSGPTLREPPLWFGP